MALLDTLKSGLKSAGNAVLGAVAPGASAVKTAVSGLTSAAKSQTQAKSAASLAPTPATTKTTLGAYVGEPTSSYATGKPIGQSPLTNSSSGQTTKSNAAFVAPQMSKVPAGTISTNTAAPATTAAPVNTQISGSNPFGNPSYTPTFSNPTHAPTVNTQNLTPPPTGYVNTPSPTAGALNGIQSTQNSQLSELQKALLGTYDQTPEEKQAQDALVALAQQQADLSGAYRSGTNKIGEQPIVLDLLRGQQQALQKQYEGQVGALADQAKPLEVQLANLVANREQQNKALTAEYGFASEEQKRQDAIQQAQASGNKPIEVGGSLLQLNPQTGQYEVIYRAPSEGADGFTLSEGQKRYDAQGNLIAGSDKFGDGFGEAPTIKTINGVDSQWNPTTGTWDPVMTSGSTPKAQAQLQTIDTLLSSVDSVLNHPGLNSRVGWQGSLPAVPGTAGADFDSRLDFMKAQLGKMGVELLKGLGAMSDGERDAMTKSFSTIAKTQSEAEFKTELNRIKEVFNKQKGILSQGSTQSGQITTQSLVQRGVRQDLIDQLTAMGKTPQEIAQIAGFSFTNASNSALNSSKTEAVRSVKPNGAWGGQCGEFIHNIVKDYPYGLNGINQKESIINVPKTQLPQVGDVLIQRVAGSTGHVAVVNHVDPKTGKITLTESNWNNNEKVSNNRTMSVNSPTISGYYRGSLAV
jgi:hypothetical protein